MSDPLVRYYSDRAPEYDRVYAKPERQDDLRTLRSLVADWAASRRVLELACGTGYWTEVMATSARSIVATDVNESVLDVARTREDPRGVIQLRTADAMRPEDIAGDFDSIFAGFWLSHLSRADMPRFVAAVNDRLVSSASSAADPRDTDAGASGATVLLIDNRFVKGSNTPISRRDPSGDTYQVRRLDSGEEFEVLKNFPSRDELIALLAPHAARPAVRELRYYWTASWGAS